MLGSGASVSFGVGVWAKTRAGAPKRHSLPACSLWTERAPLSPLLLSCPPLWSWVKSAQSSPSNSSSSSDSSSDSDFEPSQNHSQGACVVHKEGSFLCEGRPCPAGASEVPGLGLNLRGLRPSPPWD